MKSLRKFLYQEQIQAAMVSGLSMIGMALFFGLNDGGGLPPFEAVIPALVFIGFEVAHGTGCQNALARVELWNLVAMLAAGLIMLRYLIW